MEFGRGTRVIAGTLAIAAGAGGAAILAEQAAQTQVQNVTIENSANNALIASTESACGQPLDLNAEVANDLKNVGGPNSLFPSLQTTENDGTTKLVPLQQAKDAIKAQLLGDSRVLGIFTAFFVETRKAQQEPDTATLGRAEELTTFFQNNPAAAAEAASYACTQVQDYLVKQESFAVTKDQAVFLQARHNGNNIDRIGFTKVNTTGLLQGFELAGDYDDPQLEQQDPAAIPIEQKLQKLMLFTGDGQIAINELINGAFDVVQNGAPNVPAHLELRHGKVVLVSPKILPTLHLSSGNANSSGGATGGEHGVGTVPEDESGTSTGPKTGTKPGPKKSPQGGTTTSTGTTPSRTTTTPRRTTTTTPGRTTPTTPTRTTTTPTRTTTTVVTTPTSTTTTATTPATTTETTTVVTTTTPTGTAPKTTAPSCTIPAMCGE